MYKPVHSISLIWFLAISYLLSAILLSDCKFENYLFLNHTHTHIWVCGKVFARYFLYESFNSQVSGYLKLYIALQQEKMRVTSTHDTTKCKVTLKVRWKIKCICLAHVCLKNLVIFWLEDKTMLRIRFPTILSSDSRCKIKRNFLSSSQIFL